MVKMPVGEKHGYGMLPSRVHSGHASRNVGVVYRRPLTAFATSFDAFFFEGGFCGFGVFFVIGLTAFCCAFAAMMSSTMGS